MKKEAAINKLIASMYTEGIISIRHDRRIRTYLEWLYQVGQEERVKELVSHNKRKVVQYDLQERVLGRFNSAVEASREMECSTSTIYESIWHDRPTKKGHIWRYAKNE